MGSTQSARATHFQRPKEETAHDEPGGREDSSPDTEEHHISISNKMVERLVEDATLAGGAAAAREQDVPRDDLRDKSYHEKLKNLDDWHSERHGLTEEEIRAMVARVELRTGQMVSAEPVCGDIRQKVINCYNDEEYTNKIKCYDLIDEFSKCVESKTDSKLKAHVQREARLMALREKHLAHAKEHALKDIGTPQSTT